MKLLIGEYKIKLTDKNRLAIPKQFREVLGKEVVVTKGYEGCLIIVGVSQFENFLGELRSGPFLSKSIRDTTRFLVGSASRVILDKQGRFVVPQNLRNYSKINEEVIFVGLYRWVEVWASNKWKERIREIEKRHDEIAEEVLRLSKDEKEL